MALAKFESNISSSRGYEKKSLLQNDYNMADSGLANFGTPYNNYNGGISYSIGNMIEDMLQFIAVLISIGLSAFAFFFFLYIIISLYKKGGEKTLIELKGFGGAVKKSIISSLDYIKTLFLKLIKFFWNRKILSFGIIILFGIISFIGDVLDGKSRILKLVKINPGYVGIDLKNNIISNPGYHLYSPIRSGFFLSPTNNFSFDIVDVKANSKEDLAVTLEYRTTFKLLDNKRLKLYREHGAKNIRLVSSDIVMPRILEVINGVIKNYGFKDISNKHSEIKKVTISEANKVLTNIGIEIMDLNILSIKLPYSYIKSQEDLLKAENELRLSQAKLESQKKESEKKLLEASNNKKVKIIEAEALAEFNKIINSQELTPRMIEMKKLEIEELKIKKWDGKMPTSVGGEIGL